MSTSQRLRANAFGAVDYKAQRYHVSRDGVPENVEVLSGSKYRYLDLVVSALFREGLDVVTETTTATSFGNDERVEELKYVLRLYPDRVLFTRATRVARNVCRREGIADGGELDDREAASALWRHVRATGVARVWRAVDPELKRQRYDPVRCVGLKVFIRLRSMGYPRDRMREEVLRYLPDRRDLSGDELCVIGNGRDISDTKAAAFVCACMEPESRRSRGGFTRVVGLHEDAHPNLYRQILLASNDSKGQSYRYQHFAGIPRARFVRAARRLRREVLARLPDSPDLPAPPYWYGRVTSPAGIQDSVPRADIAHLAAQQVLY